MSINCSGAKFALKTVIMVDRFNPVGPAEESDANKPSSGSKLFWFIGIALVSVACVASVAYVMRALLLG